MLIGTSPLTLQTEKYLVGLEEVNGDGCANAQAAKQVALLKEFGVNPALIVAWSGDTTNVVPDTFRKATEMENKLLPAGKQITQDYIPCMDHMIASVTNDAAQRFKCLHFVLFSMNIYVSALPNRETVQARGWFKSTPNVHATIKKVNAAAVLLHNTSLEATHFQQQEQIRVNNLKFLAHHINATEAQVKDEAFARCHSTLPTRVPTHFVADWPQLDVAYESWTSLQQAITNSAGQSPLNMKDLLEQIMAIFFHFKQTQVKTAGENYPTIPLALQSLFQLHLMLQEDQPLQVFANGKGDKVRKLKAIPSNQILPEIQIFKKEFDIALQARLRFQNLASWTLLNFPMRLACLTHPCFNKFSWAGLYCGTLMDAAMTDAMTACTARQDGFDFFPYWIRNEDLDLDTLWSDKRPDAAYFDYSLCFSDNLPPDEDEKEMKDEVQTEFQSSAEQYLKSLIPQAPAPAKQKRRGLFKDERRARTKMKDCIRNELAAFVKDGFNDMVKLGISPTCPTVSFYILLCIVQYIFLVVLFIVNIYVLYILYIYICIIIIFCK